MSVARELYRTFSYSGKATPTKLTRQANGHWFVEFDIEMEMRIRDGREIVIRKRISAQANQQIGRRSSVNGTASNTP